MNTKGEMFAYYTPLNMSPFLTKVPVCYAKTSKHYEGFHEPFWICVSELTDDYELVIRHNFKDNFKGAY